MFYVIFVKKYLDTVENYKFSTFELWWYKKNATISKHVFRNIKHKYVCLHVVNRMNIGFFGEGSTLKSNGKNDFKDVL